MTKKSCERGSKKRESHVRTTYGNMKLPNPVSVQSTCVKNFEKKLAVACPDGMFKRASFERKKYAGAKLCRSISVKGTCVKFPSPTEKKSKSAKKCCSCTKK